MLTIEKMPEKDWDFPYGYKVYSVGDHVGLMTKEGGNYEWKQVVMVEPVKPRFEEDTTNWLISAGSTYDADDINDWLEPGTNILYVLAFAVDCDRNVKVLIQQPKSKNRFGIKSTPEGFVTQELSSIDKCTVTLYSWGKDNVPKFYLKNNTEYTPKKLRLWVWGHKYLTKPHQGKAADFISFVPVGDDASGDHIEVGV